MVVSRRELLKGGAAVAAMLALGRLQAATPAVAMAAPAPAAYHDWRDVYRALWRWDRVVRGTHSSANCAAACAWNLYVRDGVVWREEQSAPYAPSNATVPDWNPRGCQKGASCSALATGETRLRHPIRRDGPRGSGRWRRIGWDEALDEIARAIVDAVARRGGEGVVCELGGNMDYGPTFAGTLRFFHLLGAPVTDSTAHLGDLPVGGTITLGAGLTGGSSDDWFRSDYLVLWAFNPSATRIPDAHFLNEARYRGARVVSITPDYGQSAIHADLWLSPRPGTDAALALGACRVVLDEGLHQADYVREQSDLPFLVRTDTRRYLRESDVVAGGREDRFAIWDEAAGALAWAPGTPGSPQRTLALAGVRPALEHRGEVLLAAGGHAPVRTVLSLLRERLPSLEAAASITGVAADVIRRFARDFASARSAMVLASYGACKNYHSDLIQRSQILLASLTGNLGRAGGGWHSSGFLALEGLGLVGMHEGLGITDLVWLGARSFIDAEGVKREFLKTHVSSTLFHAVHGGTGNVQLAPEYGDPALPRPPRAYLEEALARKHFPIGPPPDAAPPEVVISICGNVLRHTRMGQNIRDHLFAQAKLVVDIGFRMSETARWSDIVLPAAGWYEKIGLKYLVTYVPYLTLGDRAVPPLAESKPEWEMFFRLAERVAAEAKRRGVTQVRAFHGATADVSRLDERFGDHGRFGPGSEEDVMQYILKVSSPSRGISIEDLRREGGAIRVKALGPEGATSGIYSDYRADEPIVPLRDFVEKKRPYPTLTGRQQFYVDHPWFLELGEELPVHKEPPAAGGRHPFTLTGGHTRHSIHSIWRDHPLMLRLERGEPVIYVNAADAREREIADHDLVEVSNDLGSFVARAKPTGAIRPGQVHIFHAWEPFQFRTNRSHQSLAPSPIKVTQLVGDYGHLHWDVSYWEPNGNDRDTRVDIRRL
ncbi:MAG: molybdopterin-dependent oxidoreductase [Candidatus Binatia bacterium]